MQLNDAINMKKTVKSVQTLRIYQMWTLCFRPTGGGWDRADHPVDDPHDAQGGRVELGVGFSALLLPPCTSTSRKDHMASR